MPSRIVREGIIDSARMELLVREGGGWGAECFYRRLHQVVDDYGRYDGRVSVVRARCYPTLLDLVRDSDVNRWIAACVKVKLVRVYEVKGQAFLLVLDFKQHARSPSKWPEPPPEICNTDATQVQSKCAPYSEAHCALRSSENTNGGSVAPPPGLPLGLLRVWEASPAKARERSSRKDCAAVWSRLKLEPLTESVLAGLEAWARSDAWQKEGGQFVKGLHRWLASRKWEEPPDPNMGSKGKSRRELELDQVVSEVGNETH